MHHAKEENILFPKMAEKGFSPDQGPVAVMLHEHVDGRNFIRAVSDSLQLYINGDTSVLPEISQNILGYVFLLRNHISKENNILFKMADKVLSGSEQEKLLNEFDNAIKKYSPGKTPADYISQIGVLASFYKV
jgi:hemerythrin-like domain-containing protein